MHVYTDGSCHGNPGVGGWGVVIKYEIKEIRLFGSEEKTTNNRMELTAVIEAFQFIEKNLSVKIFSDSMYVINGITKWIQNWKNKDWKKVKNRDLWEILDSLVQKRKENGSETTWKWVKGHSNNEGNNLADKLANKAVDMRKNGE